MTNKSLKLTTLLAALGLSLGTVFADEITTDITKLPQAAQEFAAKAFPNAKIVGIEIDTSLVKPTKYDATLSDGSKIEFDSKGNWTDIESKFTGVPQALLTKEIAAYLDANYKGQKVKAISKERYGWEVDLVNGLELKFSAAGQLIEIDD